MKTDENGVLSFDSKDLMSLIYSGDQHKCHIVLCKEDDDIEKFNQVAEQFGFDPLSIYVPIDIDKKEFDQVLQSEWLMPDRYKNMSDKMLFHYLMGLNEGRDDVPDRFDRMYEEYQEFEQRGMLNLLKYMIYLVDFMRENNIVWGVGRGSSVASYILFLIGIHKIDSFKYNLDWREFLR